MKQLIKQTPQEMMNQWQQIIDQVSDQPDTLNQLKGKRLLILGGSYLQVPAVLEAKSLGLVTAVMDYDPNCLGRDLADEFYPESTFDEEATLRCAQAFKADGIITLGTDWPMRSVAYACGHLGLPAISYDIACRSTHKLDMIRQLAAKGVEHPHFIYFDSSRQTPDQIRSKISLPCIIKPVDGSGSRGVVLLQHPEDLDEAITYSSSQAKHGQVIIEEYMEGPEVSVEVIILDSKPLVLTITDKTTTGYPHFVETQHVQPSRLPESWQSEINELAIKACLALELTHGAAHVEIIYTQSGPKIVEVGPRMGGDFIATHLVPLSTGINMTQLVILNALGVNLKLPQKDHKGACIRYLDRGQGTFLGVDNLEEIQDLQGVVQAGIFLPIGTKVLDLHSSNDRLGYIITQGDSAEEAVECAVKANDRLNIRMEK